MFRNLTLEQISQLPFEEQLKLVEAISAAEAEGKSQNSMAESKRLDGGVDAAIQESIKLAEEQAKIAAAEEAAIQESVKLAREQDLRIAEAQENELRMALHYSSLSHQISEKDKLFRERFAQQLKEDAEREVKEAEAKRKAEEFARKQAQVKQNEQTAKAVAQINEAFSPTKTKPRFEKPKFESKAHGQKNFKDTKPDLLNPQLDPHDVSPRKGSINTLFGNSFITNSDLDPWETTLEDKQVAKKILNQVAETIKLAKSLCNRR